MGKWQNLTALQKAQVIKFAIQNGVSNINDIRDTYNLYANDANLVHKYDGEQVGQDQKLSTIAKDIAYRIMSQSPGERRDWKDIKAAVQDYMNGVEPQINYTGTHGYGLDVTEADPTEDTRDANWLYLHGNTKNHYTPIPQQDQRGHSYDDFINEHYPNKEVVEYYGQMTPVEQVNLPAGSSPLVEFLSNNDLGIYTGETVQGIDAKDREEYRKYIRQNAIVDDVASYRVGVGKSPQGNHEFQMSDLYDFGGGDYLRNWGLIPALQGAALTAVGNPFLLRQYVPINYVENEQDINESGIHTLVQMAAKNKVASVENDGTLHMIGSPFEIEVTPKNTIVKNASGEIFDKNQYQEEQQADMLNRQWLLKAINPMYSTSGNIVYKKSTGGPLYPFSFEKNPFLKTPAVRYDEGGQKYTVKSGDYLGKIAGVYGLTVSDIVSANPGLNPDKINVGQVLNIPNVNKTPTKEAIVGAAWQNENPNNVGYKNGLYYPYKDPNGRGMNVGPGLLVGVAIPEKESYTKEELDEAAYTYGLNSLNAIGQAFNEKYGTTELATPFDTVSIAPKLLALDTRYQNGSLPVSGWPSFYKALAEGNWAEALKQSRSTYTDAKGVKHYDNDRVRRRAEALFPNMFNVTFKPDSKELPGVTKKK